MTYQVISGERAGTYMVLTPLPSLRVLDDGRPATPSYAEGDRAAANKISADSELVRERLWFRIEPRFSYVSDEFADGEAGFWHSRNGVKRTSRERGGFTLLELLLVTSVANASGRDIRGTQSGEARRSIFMDFVHGCRAGARSFVRLVCQIRSVPLGAAIRWPC